MALQTLPWDAADHLTTPEDVALYLEAVLDENDPELLRVALGDIARARGLPALAADMGLSGQSLQSILAADGQARFETVVRILQAFGIRLTATPASDAA